MTREEIILSILTKAVSGTDKEIYTDKERKDFAQHTARVVNYPLAKDLWASLNQML